MNKLLEFINSKISLNEESQNKLLSSTNEKFYKKGEWLLPFYSYCRHYYFITKGLVKLSFDTDDGEFVMRFFEENILFTELESLTTNKLSKYQIIALEDVNCIRLPKTAFKQLYDEYPKFSAFHGKLLTMAHINMLNRISEMLESDAKARYLNFVKQNGHLMNRISLGELSKYLGINQVTLSRIRNQK